MAASDGGHISFVGKVAADDSAALSTPYLHEKDTKHDTNSTYDEEEVVVSKESDFRHKQVRKFDSYVYFDSFSNNTIEIQRMDANVVGLPGNWSNLWRHWVS